MPARSSRRAWHFWRPDVAAEVDEELAFHVDMRAAEYEARGLSRAEAERIASTRLGDLTNVRQQLVAHDQARARRRDRREHMQRLVQDVRLALRGFRRTPAFALSTIVILALGIGLASAMVTVYDAVLRRPLPVRDQDRIAVLWTYQQPGIEFSVSMRTVRQLARDSRMLRDVAGMVHWGATAAPLLDGDRSVVLDRALVTGNFFDVLGARAVVGRLLRPEDEVRGARSVLVLSHAAWRTQFGSDPTVIGRTLVMPYTRQGYTIVGVAPPGLDYPAGVGYWMPYWGFDQQVLAIGRLAPNATLDEARAEFFAITSRLEPASHLRGAMAMRFAQAVVGEVTPYLVVLTTAVGLLLLIACVNVGNLLLMRAAGRARELAVRRALGASYADVARQLLVESSALGVAGGVLGLGCAEIMRRLLVALAPPQLPRLEAVRLAGAPLGISLAVTLLALLVFGVLSALGAARVDLASPLRQNARSGGATRRGRAVRQWLVASQIALAVVMLAAAGLLARSLARLEHLPLGYTSDHLSILSLSWYAMRDSTRAQIVDRGERSLSRLTAVPGVSSATPILITPLTGKNVWQWRFEAEGQPRPSGEAPNIAVEIGGADYFRTFDIPVIRGRGFLPSDGATAPKIAVVSEAVARRFWPNGDPIGRRIGLPNVPGFLGPPGLTEWITVVGVTGDTRFRALREAAPMIYLPWHQVTGWQGFFAVRSTLPLASLRPSLQRALHDVDPTLTLWSAQTMDELLDAPLAQPRLGALLVSAFAAVALLLAAVGLYGIMANVVHERTREIGVRMTLGATPQRVRRDVLTDALRIITFGAVIGLVGALAGTRLLAAVLFEISPTDPLTLVGVCVTLIGVALAAAYLPARRATRVDPARALRAD